MRRRRSWARFGAMAVSCKVTVYLTLVAGGRRDAADVAQWRTGLIRLQESRGRKLDGGDYVRADHRIQYGRMKQVGELAVDRQG